MNLFYPYLYIRHYIVFNSFKCNQEPIYYTFKNTVRCFIKNVQTEIVTIIINVKKDKSVFVGFVI